jgi:N-acetylglucosamine kinase-like BadF-type ATPase
VVNQSAQVRDEIAASVRSVVAELDYRPATAAQHLAKSHLFITDEAGRAVGFAVGGSANHEVVDYGAITDLVREMFVAALSTAGLRGDQIAGAALGIAGFDWQSERAAQLSALTAAGLQGFPLEIVNDAVVDLLAGST